MIGVRFDAKVQTTFGKSLPCQFIIHFYDVTGSALPAISREYSDQAGEMSAWVDFVPAAGPVSTEILNLFVPYQAISTTPGVTGVLASAKVWCTPRKEYIEIGPRKSWMTVTNGPVDPRAVAQVEASIKESEQDPFLRALSQDMDQLIGPLADILEFTKTHNFELNGVKGVRFDAKVQTTFGKGLSCEFIIHFCEVTGRALPAIAREYSDQAGEMCAWVDFVPAGGTVSTETLNLFVPYQAISTTVGVTGVLVFARVWCITRKKYIQIAPNELWLVVTNGPVDLATVAEAETGLKDALYRDVIKRIQSLQIQSATDKLVYDTLIGIAKNIYPKDPITGQPLF